MIYVILGSSITKSTPVCGTATRLLVSSYVFGWNEPEVSDWVWIVWVVTVAVPELAVLFYNVRLLTVSGQTIGKRLMGVRIVNAETFERVGFIRVFLLREVARLVLLTIAPLGKPADVIVMLYRQDSRSIHDLVTGTAVVEMPRVADNKCRVCGSGNPVDGKFCGGCGASLSASTARRRALIVGQEHPSSA